ncbi:Transmembrane protein 43 [Stylophora pistillata]|uniref:Transmembrane protein 43 n=1 Tax=Stylophora pistillata TaxID=50429 RepID=A0A2B4RN41_STYPI|nr:Transmembrane protein 43 [Stylophora pistillata]
MHNIGSSPSDSHVRVSYKENPGFFSKVQESFCASLFGILLVIVSFPVLYWNEGRAVQTALSLDEGLRQVVHIDYVDQISPEYQDKLVHLSGSLQTDRALSDSDYGVAVKAVKLRRKVEMYQWVEHKHTREYDEGERKRVETTFSYRLQDIGNFVSQLESDIEKFDNKELVAEIRRTNNLLGSANLKNTGKDKEIKENTATEWRDTIIRSDGFDNPAGHQNPNSMPVQSYIKEADSVRVGAFSLSRGLIGKIDVFQPLSPREVPHGKMISIHNGMFYHTMDQFHPKVGDVRVQFSYAGLSGKPHSGLGDPMKVSIVARQQGGKLSHYHTKSGDSLELLYPGEMSAEMRTVPSCFKTGTMGAVHSENSTGDNMPSFCNRSISVSTFALSAYGTGQPS